MSIMNELSEDKSLSIKSILLPVFLTTIILFILGLVAINAFKINQTSKDTRSKAAMRKTGQSTRIQTAGNSIIPPTEKQNTVGLVSNPPHYIKVVNGDSDTIDYAYAPAIIKENDKYYAFFCSVGGRRDQRYAWDYVRMTTSTNGIDWTPSVVKVRAINKITALPTPPAGNSKTVDAAACDPSIIKYRGPNDTQDYYYMFYSSYWEDHKEMVAGNPTSSGGTVILVARSTTIDGEYVKYTENEQWEADNTINTPYDNQPLSPQNPKIIIAPLRYPSTTYGAGQSTLVLYNGKIRMWYTDTSLDPNAQARIYMLDSNNPVVWNPNANAEVTALYGKNSDDIRYDDVARKFYILHAEGYPHSYMTMSSSNDGKVWKAFSTVIPQGLFPNHAGNTGFSSDAHGHIIQNEPILFSFGVDPYDPTFIIPPTEVPADRFRMSMFSIKISSLNPKPIGFQDPTTSCTTVSGWTCDANDYTKSVQVHIYADGPAGQGGRLVGTSIANISAEPGVANSCAGIATHRFSLTLPTNLKDGVAHTLYVYAINIDHNGDQLGDNPILTNSPTAITCGTSATPTVVNQGRIGLDLTNGTGDAVQLTRSRVLHYENGNYVQVSATYPSKTLQNGEPYNLRFSGVNCQDGDSTYAIDMNFRMPASASTVTIRQVNAVECGTHEAYTLRIGSTPPTAIPPTSTPQPQSQACSVDIQPPTVSGNATSVDLYARNVPSTATAVRFPTWSDFNGQDDIVWYSGTNEGGGTWKMTINPQSHPTSTTNSTVIVHVYYNTPQAPNGTFCSNSSFTRTSSAQPTATPAQSCLPRLGVCSDSSECCNGLSCRNNKGTMRCL